MKIKDIEYKTHALAEIPFKQNMVVNDGEYYMVCNKCGGNNLKHTNWYEAKRYDTELIIKCLDCNHSEKISEMSIKTIW